MDEVKYYPARMDYPNLCKPYSNADRIRSMSDEELAMFLCDFRSCDADEYICEGCKAAKYCRAGHTGTIDWLQQPAEEVDNETVGERKDGDWNG